MRIPPNLSPELQSALRELWAQIDKVAGPNNIDLHGRRILNAGDAVGASEYVTRAEFERVVSRVAAVGQSLSSVASGLTGATKTGTHAERLAASVTDLTAGTTWYETDRTVTYTLLASKAWSYTSGVMVGLDGAWPTDLGTSDTGFRYDASDTLKGYRWTGTAWEFSSPLDPPTTAPETPNTPTPVDNSDSASLYPTLTWVCARGTTFDVYFGDTVSPPLVSSDQTALSYAPTGPLTEGDTYYWKIVATNVHGETTGSVWSFTAEPAAVDVPGTPSSPSPADLATGVALTPTLSWSATGATSYTVFFGNGSFTSTAAFEVEMGYVADCDGFDYGMANYTMPDEVALLTPSDRFGPAWFNNSAEYSDGWVTDCGAQTEPAIAATNIPLATWSPRRLAPEIVQKWKIRAHNAAGYTDGDEWDFVTIAASGSAPSSPTSPSPANAATGQSTSGLTLTWSAPGATAYDVYFGTAASPGVVASNTPWASYALGSLSASTTYYWKIVAKNSAGSTTGSVWSFTTAGATLGTPSTPSPTDGTTGAELTLTLGWAATPGAAHYTVRLATSRSPTPAIVATGLSTPSYKPAGLVENTQYYWLVQAYASDGTRETGPIWSFKTKASPVTPPSGVPDEPTGHSIDIDGNRFRVAATGALWKWHFASYFGMFYAYLNGGIPAGVYDWARAIGVNGFRVFVMKDTRRRGGGFPWAPFTPDDYNDTQLDAFLTEVETAGFYVQIVALCDTDPQTGWDGLPSMSARQTHLDRIAAVCEGHTKTFVENCNEPYVNGFTADQLNSLTCASAVWICKGSGTAPYPYVPVWHYGTEHTPRDGEWERKSKDLIEYQEIGGEGDHGDNFEPYGVPFIGNEPMGIDEAANIAVALNGSQRSNEPQKFADYFALADLLGSGATIHAQCLGLQNTVPDGNWPDTEACCDAIRQVWADLSPDETVGAYTAGHISTCPLYHDLSAALKIYGRINGNSAVCVVVRKSAGYYNQPQNGWRVVGEYGYNGNIVKLVHD